LPNAQNGRGKVARQCENAAGTCDLQTAGDSKGASVFPLSLLGYDFLNRGMMADAVLGGKNFQIFRLLGGTSESALNAFERFRSQLTGEKIEKGESGATFLEGLDQLYGPVILLKKGTCIAGALKFSDKNGIAPLLEKICK
jgi:hypothetical protein